MRKAALRRADMELWQEFRQLNLALADNYSIYIVVLCVGVRGDEWIQNCLKAETS